MLFDFVLLLIAILPLFDARRIQNLLRRSALKIHGHSISVPEGPQENSPG